MVSKPRLTVTQIIYCPLLKAPEWLEAKAVRGTIMHALISQEISQKHGGCEVEPEIVYEDEEFILVGHPDVVCVKNDKILLFEIKPLHHKVKEEWLMQINIYASMVYTYYKKPVEAFIVMYNGQNTTINRIFADVEYLQRALPSIRDYAKLHSKGKLRKRTYLCRYCQDAECPLKYNEQRKFHFEPM